MDKNIIRTKVFIGDTLDTADKDFNKWNKANPNIVIDKIKFKIEDRYQFIFVVYRDYEERR